MQLFKTLLAGAALIAAVAAEKLAFTSFPSGLTAGQPFTVTWTGGNADLPVTITLRHGPSDDLKDVSILTSSATGGSYTFTPSTSLVSGTDYALQISQGSEINYTGLFTITGGHGTPSSTPATTTASSSSSGEPTKPVTKPAVTSTSQASMSMTNSANHTTMVTKTSTGTASMGTATTTSHRNTTMSSPTLTSQSQSATLTPTATPTGGAASLTALSSPLALIMAALVAFAYLN
ncbi:extracellular matrix protein [Nannizzia gypsea CBS 118893]|uniref:Extracellular matrix protein n=1 Tax=Arthroderma gypseum (strain ATCC MYA-4604 / CBS 118893) TaxID=535722 RepID=E4UYI9_ARTGP|nr:extracellular matrix protein [Nannizzia gypsea CBS 118893]EFR02152.1 extracellular matrix protein [Nannizzia gypsea CBS 118893]